MVPLSELKIRWTSKNLVIVNFSIAFLKKLESSSTPLSPHIQSLLGNLTDSNFKISIIQFLLALW